MFAFDQNDQNQNQNWTMKGIVVSAIPFSVSSLGEHNGVCGTSCLPYGLDGWHRTGYFAVLKQIASLGL